jgi:hypothetical protein
MAVHLVLLGVNKLHLDLAGKIPVYTNCNGALQKVENLPPLCILSRCLHADILKNILINCLSLLFQVELYLIKAHQDDLRDFSTLSRPAQLTCAVDAGAKILLQNAYATRPASRPCFPLELIVCYMGKER